MAFGDTTSEISRPPPHRPPQPHAAAPSEQQRGSQPECGGRGEGHRTEGGIERVNKPEQINIISPTLAPQTDGPRTESDKLPDGRPSSWRAAERRTVPLAAHMAASAAKAAFVQIVQRRRRRRETNRYPFFPPTTESEERRPATACVVFGRLLLEGRERERAD